MKVGPVHHIAINTKDIDKSIKFYQDVLGLKKRETVRFDELALTYFELPAGGRLELFDYKGKNPQCERDEAEVGLRHVAFSVDDVAQHEKELREAGVTITLPTTELLELGARVLLFLDPNGVTIEFCENL